MKKIVILGSTGTVGQNTLNVIRNFPEEFKVVGLSSYSNAQLLAEQAAEFYPDAVCLVDESKAKAFTADGSGNFKDFYSGKDGLLSLSTLKDADAVVVAISGAAAILPLVNAIKAGKDICIANKESLVAAGKIIIDLAKENGVSIIPVDSEHSAIFQCLTSSVSEVNRLCLTGSGGSLLNVSQKEFPSLKVSEVLNHPKWNMGKKITVDSATLMNKGLEVIEASVLFGVDIAKIDVVIHPEAVIHSMVEFIDGSIIAQLGIADMQLPIQYALTYPKRLSSEHLRLDFKKIRNLTFCEPDNAKFPCLRLAIDSAGKGGTYPAALNAANEVAVNAFLKEEISFNEIPGIIEKVLSNHKGVDMPSLDDVFAADSWAREEAKAIC
ncbi:MAG: 1-deoxy-D-xylulose-5-phosphate reductoisomerase [Candidatus Omnitrophota bacterium]